MENRLLLIGDAEIEPNNVIGSATAITLIDDPSGSGLLTAYGEGEMNPATSGNTWSDPDYFSFPALAGDVISVTVATPGSDVNPYVELRNSADVVTRNGINLESDADYANDSVGGADLLDLNQGTPGLLSASEWIRIPC